MQKLIFWWIVQKKSIYLKQKVMYGNIINTLSINQFNAHLLYKSIDFLLK